MRTEQNRRHEIRLPGGLGELDIFASPDGTPVTPASEVSLEVIGNQRHLLRGVGIDWGSGTGCLAIGAARIDEVATVIGLELNEANLPVADQNIRVNGVQNKVQMLWSDSYKPRSAAGRQTLEALQGGVDFIIANPPSSDGDDGFGFRRRVLQEGREFLVAGGIVLLSVSLQYGHDRLMRLCQDAPGFKYEGLLASTDWMPFDLNRSDLFACLHAYAAEERRGGGSYTFRSARSERQETINAGAALAEFELTAESPLSKWQTHLFRFAGPPG